jgi:hypothetical protein
MRRIAAILALLSLLILPAPIEAKPLPTLSVRELVLHAETILLAEPVERLDVPTRFKVLEVLRSDGLKPGDTFTIDPGLHNLRDTGPTLLPLEKRKPPTVEQALLFLGPNRGTRGQPHFEPVASGLRFWTRDHSLLVPVQIANPGGFFMEERRDVDWGELVRQARADAGTIADLFARKKLRPIGRRNRALLEWVESHQHEFGAPMNAEHPEKTAQGWGHLETDIFQWVLASCEPGDCWLAVKLYAELNRGTVPPLHEPAFGTRDGRALLLRIATADDALEGDRLRALSLLSHPFTLWAGPLPRFPRLRFLDAKEQTDLIDRLTPLLASKSAPLRAATARTLRCVCNPEVVADEHRKSQRALPALVKAFRLEYPGEPRDQIASAIGVLGAKHWQELTGNPPGMVVLLRDLERRDKQVHFWLNLRPCGQVVYEQPTLVLERINQSQAAMETKQMPLPVANLPRPWGEGWDGSSVLLVEFSVQDFKDGTWRVSVRGTAGKDKDKSKWTSEPKTFVIDPPPKANNGQPVLGGNW